MIYLIVILALVCIIMHDYSIKHVLDNLIYTITPSKAVVEPNEDFLLVSTIKNDKWLPVTYLRMSENIPLEIVIKPGEFIRDKSETHIVSSTYLLPHQSLKRTYDVSLKKRGRYFLRGVTLYGGDVFGVSETMDTCSLAQEIVVLPKSCGDGNVDNILGGFLGDISVNRFITPDPILTVGSREYTGNEPMKHINWASSLKMGKLMVKNFDHTTSASVTVVLNVECNGAHEARDGERIEVVFGVARYVCQTLENKHIKYSFVTNATSAGVLGHWSTAPEGLGNRHFYNICEGLGRATYESTREFGALLKAAAKRAENGRGHIIITPTTSPSWTEACAGLKTVTNAPCLIITADRFVKTEEKAEGENK